MKKLHNPPSQTWNELVKRPVQSYARVEHLVKDVFNEVALKGDTAVATYTLLFDHIQIEKTMVTPEEVEAAIQMVPEDLKQAITFAAANIKKFHEAQRTSRVQVETCEGVMCWQEKKPIHSVGLYIPGGSAPLFSTVLMLAIPAALAGCREIVLCTPPDQLGNVSPAILFAASVCGVKKIVKIGGIQAIAAMTFGTATVPRVDKIFGPGNQYVTAAKQLALQFGVAIDMPAGPSEVLVVADETAVPAFVASDLLSQAEHGADSQVVLVTTSATLMAEVEDELDRQLEALPRKETAAEALKNSLFIFLEKKENVIDFVNRYAPEHLIICSKNEEFYLQHLENAGSVFLGNYSPESAGDYASGTNHTLPTDGNARAYSGVNLDSFFKTVTFQKISRQGLQNLGKQVEIMATAEGLQAHANAISIRLKTLTQNRDDK